jgi:hypothetical protein
MKKRKNKDFFGEQLIRDTLCLTLDYLPEDNVEGFLRFDASKINNKGDDSVPIEGCSVYLRKGNTLRERQQFLDKAMAFLCPVYSKGQNITLLVRELAWFNNDSDWHTTASRDLEYADS